MTYTQQVHFWAWAWRASASLGGLGSLLWLTHATAAATVAGVFMAPLGFAGAVILFYEYTKVREMDDADIITYVTRGQLRRHTIGAILLLSLLTIIFILAFLHLVFGLWV